jgi:hypothetical protein
VLTKAKNVDFSIVNIFPGSEEEKPIDITPEDESTETQQ